MSSSVDAEHLATPGSTSRGTRDVDDEQRATVARAPSPLRCRALDEHLGRRRSTTSSTSPSTSASGTSSRATARPPTRSREVVDRDSACGWRRRSRRRPRPPARRAMPSPISPAPSTSTRRPSSEPSCSAASATAADEIDTACRPIAGLGARPACPTSIAWRNVRDEQRAAGALVLGELPRLAHLAEDLALADDHRVEPGGDPKRCATAASSWYV